MNNKEYYNSLSDEVKKKLGECKTSEDMKNVLIEAGVEPLDDELLDAASGGMRDPAFWDEQGHRIY